MSIYDKASLVLIPSGTKTSKIYSQKPVNGDGDFTFSRSTAATRVNADGNIEKERTNFVKYSQDYSQWNTFGGTTLTTGITDPNGGSNAATISGIGTGTYTDGAYMLSNPVTINAGSVVNQSIYLKGSGTIAIGIERAITGAYFFYSKNVTLTSEWQRFDNFQQIPTSATGFNFYVTNASGTTASSVDIAFAQFEFGTAPTEYIPTNGSAVTTGITDNVPRLDYTDSSCPALLLEPQRTNILTNSEYFAAWIQINTLNTANALISPEGVQNANKLIAASGVNNNVIYQGLTAGTYTASIFAKKGEFEGLVIATGNVGAFFNLNTNTYRTHYGSAPTSYNIEDFGNGWHRFSITFTEAGANSLYIGPNDNVSNSLGVTGNNSDGIYIYGAQMESASYATSYIPTYGTSVTRNGDAALKTGVADLINDGDGTLYMEVTPTNFEGDQRFGISDNIGSNRIVLRLFNPSNLQLSAVINSSVEISISNSGYTAGNTYKIAGAWKNNDAVIYINGVQVATDTNCNITPSNPLTRISFDNGVGTAKWENPVSQTLYFPTRLSNEELAALTTI